MTNEEAKRIIEALLFASDRPIGIDEITAVLEDVDSRVVRDIVYELKNEYETQRRSFTLTEVAGGFQMVSDTYYAPWIKKLLASERTQRLSMPSLETLAIIAYKQPLTRSEMETIRGVNIDGVIENLLEKNLIRTHGRKEAPGRPFYYVTTEEFLMHFGLKSLQDLPPLKEFTEKDIELGDKGVIVQKPQEEALKNGTNEPAKAD